MYSNKKVVISLIKKNISISIAESFTGGLLTKSFIDISGVSKIFNMGLIVYSNESKNMLLNVPNSIIKKYGAVSKEVSIIMSKNLSIISKSNLTISTTGIAGPLGGSKYKPIGLGYISITYLKKTYTFKKKFSGSRKKIQKDAIKFCLKEVEKLI